MKTPLAICTSYDLKILAAYTQCGDNGAATAKQLGVSQIYVIRVIRRIRWKTWSAITAQACAHAVDATQ